ncbi:L,D-transpeptidase family protein [Rhodobacteraceae bacterium MCCB 386]|nr:L,D-transpeptidase family protein [Roseitranquillus sediminis]
MRRGTHAAVFACLAAAATAQSGLPEPAELSLFDQAIAEIAAEDPVLGAFYRDNGYNALWTDDTLEDRERLEAFVTALADAGHHALPVVRFRPEALRSILADADSDRERGSAEAEISRLYLAYADALQSGILSPQQIDGIKREAPRRDHAELLNDIANRDPRKVLRALAPQSPEYTRLMRAKMELERLIDSGGWGEAAADVRLDPGERGDEVVALRARLARMGYGDDTGSDLFDPALEEAVLAFQADHGLLEDGIAGPNTLEQINRSPQERMGQVVVAMERERWLNFDRGERHVWVNLADFTASIIDDGKVTFQTRSVVGATALDRRSPEFSDEMEHLVVNPTWHVPRSIAVNEYMPDFKRNPYAHGQLEIHYKGEAIARERINWHLVTASNFPFALKQPPSRSNALGLVKFMFPNRWNIYLHDTPAKDLFNRTTRAFSHGCIRLQEPFEFAYELLSRQSDDPEALFQSRLAQGVESVLPLEQPVPVHLVYRTVITTPKGGLEYWPDIYGRDAAILAALLEAGVEIGARQS